MIHRIASSLAALALAASVAFPARAATTSLDVVNKAVTAATTLDGDALKGLYAKNAVFVDEGPWSAYGPHAGQEWALEVQQRFALRKMTEFKAIPAAPTIAQEQGDSAYVVVPLKLDGHLGSGAHYHEDGAFTFSLQREAGEWKITSQVWTVLTKMITPDR